MLADALLFAAARVTEWVEVPVPRALDRPGLSQFIAGAARARELSMKDPFVFRVIGKFPVLKWHVLAGARLVHNLGIIVSLLVSRVPGSAFPPSSLISRLLRGRRARC